MGSGLLGGGFVIWFVIWFVGGIWKRLERADKRFVTCIWLSRLAQI